MAFRRKCMLFMAVVCIFLSCICSSTSDLSSGLTITNLTAFDKIIPICPSNFSEYTPCHDVNRSLLFPRDRSINRERHCPEKEEKLKCRIPAPIGYKKPLYWPTSREMVWRANIPHLLTIEKAYQKKFQLEGNWFTFPRGGSKFPRGTDTYITDIWRTTGIPFFSVRTAIDCGCGVGSWGAYLLSRGMLPLSFAPESHDKQVLLALERGVPALIGILASKRLPYPSRAFDMAHCSHCHVPWDQYGGLYLIEVDRILRPGGYWVFSGPPINWEEHSKEWNRTANELRAEQSRIEKIAYGLCWEKLNQVGDIAIWQKPINHMNCKKNKIALKEPPHFCINQNPDQAWEIDMEECQTLLPEVSNITSVAGGSLDMYPLRLTEVPPRIASGSLNGITPDVFREDIQTWEKRISYYRSLHDGLSQPWTYRSVLDMNAHLGGFAAALEWYPIWVMNVVPVEADVNTLGAIFERGLIGTYQDWCEPMSTYPRSYDFIHADSVFTLYKGRCEMEDILLEMDRILRPEGGVILVDDVDMVVKIKHYTDQMQWESRIFDHEKGPHHKEKLLVAVKQYWTAPAPTHHLMSLNPEFC